MDADPVMFPKRFVVTANISLGSFDSFISAFADKGEAHTTSYVCCVNAHMAVECSKDSRFAMVVNSADFATADGMPILKALQWFHRVDQERVAGNDIMPALIAVAAQRGLKLFLFGGTNDIHERIVARTGMEHPNLEFAGLHAPPFLPFEEMDLEADAERINSSGAHIVFVSLGCPKQEKWMAAMKGRVNAVMLGLGGAFLLYAGMDSRAPKWMRDLSLEWVYRLWLEPQRLWKRYLVTNTLFLGLFIRELVRRTFGKVPTRA